MSTNPYPLLRAAACSALILLPSTMACSGPPTFEFSDLDHLEVVSGDGQQGIAGTSLPDSVVVVAISEKGEPTSRSIEVTIDSGGGSIEIQGARAAGNGATVSGSLSSRRSIQWTLGPAEGPQTLLVSANRFNGEKISVLIHATALPAP